MCMIVLTITKPIQNIGGIADLIIVNGNMSNLNGHIVVDHID